MASGAMNKVMYTSVDVWHPIGDTRSWDAETMRTRWPPLDLESRPAGFVDHSL
jgi:hypothetical protein